MEDDAQILEVLKRDIAEFAPGLADMQFTQPLVENVLQKKGDLDKIIEKAAPDWPIDKISIIDRNILRMGLSELLFSDRTQVPPKVAINEAIELAKTFGGETSGRFVNGVLGAVYKELGEPGKEEVTKKKNKDIPFEEMPIERLGGGVVCAKNDAGEIHIALVHDIFGHWTLSKGHYLEGEEEVVGLKRIIKDEIGLDIELKEKLGQNEYVASDPEKGKIRKQVLYYLVESPFAEIVRSASGGLDDARWFKLADIVELNFYNDILPIITKAVNLLLKK
jgi:N utilization substance protein B